jgi:hypothetical protein
MKTLLIAGVAAGAIALGYTVNEHGTDWSNSVSSLYRCEQGHCTLRSLASFAPDLQHFFEKDGGLDKFVRRVTDSGETPIRVEFENGSSYGMRLIVESIADDPVTLESYSINRGNCVPKQTLNPPVTLKFGETHDLLSLGGMGLVAMMCPDVLELEIETDRGTYKFSEDPD